MFVYPGVENSFDPEPTATAQLIAPAVAVGSGLNENVEKIVAPNG